MLVVRVELHSAITGKVTEIGRTYIYNVGGTTEVGEYEVKVAKEENFDEGLRATLDDPMREGEVKDYPRLDYNVWRLVSRALRSAFPEEN